MMLMMLAPLAGIISIIGVPFLLFQASRLPVPAGPGLMGFLNVGWGDGLQDFWWFYVSFLRVLYWLCDGLMGFACGFSQPLPTQLSCESQAHADAPD